MRKLTKLMLTLALLFVAVGGAKIYASKSFGDAITSLDYITGGGKFVISDNGTKAKYFSTNNENENAALANVPNDAYYYFTLEKYTGDAVSGDNIYKIKVTNAGGEGYPRGTSGGCYLNAILNFNDAVIAGPEAGWSNVGNEIKDALWYVSYDKEKGFSFQNVYRSENTGGNDNKTWLSLEKDFSNTQQYLKLYKSIDVTPEDENVNITVGSDARNYQLYVPVNAGANCPLVISLHGAGGASTNYSPFKKSVADAEGCIVAYPQGKDTEFPIGFGGTTTGWTASGEDNFDVGFIKAVIEDVASKYQIDRKRIYCCGFSNGGMMTYALSNTCSDIFAAFASISGYPINEFHLRHAGARPVPFLHIHGKNDDFVKYSLMPTIVDEMVARLGANPVPTTTTVDGKYTKNVYQAGDGSFPYVYYEVDGMGHEAYTENTEDGNSAQTMWNFFEQYTLDSSCDPTLKWAPRIEQAGFTPASHGLTMNSGTTLLQFGGDQYTVDNKNVYHSLQFDNGEYVLSFNSTGAAVSMGVKIQKLTSPNTIVLNETVNVGEDAELPFEITDGWGEYQLTITRPSESNAITISNVVIKEGTIAGPRTIVTNTAVLLKGGKIEDCLTTGTRIIEMQGWQSFIAYEDATGVAFDEDSYLQFDLDEAVSNGGVRITFTFSDASTRQEWWCLGIGTSKDDTSTPYSHAFDNSKYWLKKGLSSVWDEKKDLNITKVTIDNFGSEDVYTYKINGGTLCGEDLIIKKNNAKSFGAYGGVFTATSAQTNIFQMKNFEVGDYQKMVIKFGAAVPSTGNWNLNKNNGLTSLSGKTEYEFELNGTAITDFTIFNMNANPDPINISEVYLFKEEEVEVLLDYNEFGVATTDKADLRAAGGLSYNPETGVLTTKGTAGKLTLEFTDPVDLKNLYKFTVNRSGNDNIIDNVKFYDADDNLINTWNSSKLQNDGLDNNATNAFINHNPVKKLVWSSAAGKSTDLTLTITGITWQLKTMSCVNAGETVLNTLSWNKVDGSGTANPDWNMHVKTDTYYGNYSGDATHYVDLTSYSELRVYRDNNDPCRAFFINSAGTGTNQVNTGSATWNAEKKYWSFDLSGVEKWEGKVALKCIKANAGVSNLTVNNIVVYSTPAANAPKYVLAGSGMQLDETAAALADATATSIDATGVTALTTKPDLYPASKIELTTANPNCLITANADQLSNTSNVIVSGDCAQLAISDGYPFCSPVDFTATAAPTYSRAFVADKTTTICLPFALTETEAETLGTFYELSSFDGGTIHLSPVAEPEANKAYLVVPTATSLTLSEPGKSIAATPADLGAEITNVEFIGTLASTSIPASDGTNSYFAFNNGSLVKIATNAATLPAFRGYFKVSTSAIGARSLNISFDEETTGVKTIDSKSFGVSKYFDLQGRRVENPTKGLYIVNGKKVVK